MNDVLQALFQRRSLRQFSDRPISSEDKELLIHSAMRAPTAGNLMSYTIIDVTDQKLKDRLAVSCDDQPMIAGAPVVLVFLADMQRLYDYFRYSGVPELCEETGQAYRTPREGDFLLAANDAIVAAQNVVVAAESLGMGSCYIGDIMENIEEHRELLSLPRWTFPVTMLIVGYPADNASNELIPRFPMENIVHENSYHHLSGDEFDEMFVGMKKLLGDAPFLKPATNIGQHFYIRKFASEFMEELRRSVKKGVEEWAAD